MLSKTTNEHTDSAIRLRPGREPDHAQRLGLVDASARVSAAMRGNLAGIASVVRAGDLAWGPDSVLVIGPAAAPAAAGRPYLDLIATRAAAGHVPAAADWGT
jgi:hypothetical protein